LEDFETARVLEGSVKPLSKRVKVVTDPALPEKDIIHSTVAVRMKNSQVHKAVVNAPLGNPANPLDMAQCQEKFAKCLAYSKIDYDESRSRELLSAIETLEDVRDVSIISSLMQV